jgi:hypothetical protein
LVSGAVCGILEPDTLPKFEAVEAEELVEPFDADCNGGSGDSRTTSAAADNTEDAEDVVDVEAVELGVSDGGCLEI